MFERFTGRPRRAVILAQEEARRFSHSMFEMFTERSYRAVTFAQEEARRFSHDYIGTEHLILGLLREGEGVAAQALISLGVTLEELRGQVESIVGHGEEEAGDGGLPFTARSEKILKLAWRESLQLGRRFGHGFDHDYIGTEHLLLGLTRESEGTAAQALSNLGVDPDEIRREVMRALFSDREGCRESQVDLKSLQGENERLAGRRHALLWGKIEGLPVNTRMGEEDGGHTVARDLLLSLEYAYYIVQGAEGALVVDHGSLLESVAGVVEERRFRLPDEAVQGAGEYALARFPEIEQVKVSLSGVWANRSASGLSVSGTFNR